MKKMMILGALVLLAVASGQLVGEDAVDREIEGGILDWIHLQARPPGPDVVIV